MSTIIRKIKLFNYRRFSKYEIEPNNKMNIFIGDNESGKSSILESIDLVSSGSIKRVESVGIEKLLSLDAVERFMSSEKNYSDLPKLIAELYLIGDFDYKMRGENNTDSENCDGIRMICEPDEDMRNEIIDVIRTNENYFPYEYYKTRFSTFADEGYSGYKKKLKTVLIDSSNMNSERSMSEFVHKMYMQYTDGLENERIAHSSKYRMKQNEFCIDALKDLNNRIPEGKDYTFGMKNSPNNNMESNLTIFENGISIDSKGTGKSVFIKTDFALGKVNNGVDVILLEEPENHLSDTNLRKLLSIIEATNNGQLFITTHSSMISTRLELNNLFILHKNDSQKPTTLQDVPIETAKYFMKTPPASLVEFSLAEKVVLVEGPAEYMLMDLFFKQEIGCIPEDKKVCILDVRGLSFKRYLYIAQKTNCKVAVITDNDKDSEQKCVKKYEEFKGANNIKIFYEPDEKKDTFEIVLYNDNKEIMDTIFGIGALQYMLNNKTEAAYRLMLENTELVVPDYIKRALLWISE